MKANRVAALLAGVMVVALQPAKPQSGSGQSGCVSSATAPGSQPPDNSCSLLDLVAALAGSGTVWPLVGSWSWADNWPDGWIAYESLTADGECEYQTECDFLDTLADATSPPGPMMCPPTLLPPLQWTDNTYFLANAYTVHDISSPCPDRTKARCGPS